MLVDDFHPGSLEVVLLVGNLRLVGNPRSEPLHHAPRFAPSRPRPGYAIFLMLAPCTFIDTETSGTVYSDGVDPGDDVPTRGFFECRSTSLRATARARGSSSSGRAGSDRKSPRLDSRHRQNSRVPA